MRQSDPHGAVLDRKSAALTFTSGGRTSTPRRCPSRTRRGRRVEAHRLRVQERAEELGRIVVAQPGRLVREQAERGRVRLREAEAREADELVVDDVRGLLVDAVRARALEEALAVGLERRLAALAAHRAPQPLRLADA